MKLSSCSLPHLYQGNTGVNAISGDKQAFPRRLADRCKLEKFPAISNSLLGKDELTGKYKITKVQEGSNDMPTTLRQPPSVAPMTTTFRESYRGLYGPPAPNTRRKDALPDPHRLGSSSYSIDFCPRPLRKRRTPPRVREGNILNSYPGNVLYPYKLPEEVITVWKPFPVQQPDSDQTAEILARLVSKMYRTSYQLDFKQK
ncbi:hypothetical protein OS493_029112 [Desmophyllum pertusum]|uniref:Uncharacterized protein n=1 Tax=Desmophyllum pertusum TaxID=174260 RepID=A0A9X0CDD0_9CNID|nr:hypothetical protein OS493_029112 [Desmophyllum pertusum]